MADMKAVHPTSHFRLTIGGVEAAGQFRELSGLDHEVDTIDGVHNDANGNPVTQKVAGNKKWSPVELKRGLDSDKALYAWHEEVVQKGQKAAHKEVMLEAIGNDGTVISTYKLVNAWPNKYSAAGMNASQNEIAVEGITIAHEGFQRMS